MNPLDYYTSASEIISIDKYSSFIKPLPEDVETIIRTVQGHVVARDFYGVSIPKNRESEIHIRPVEKLLDTIMSLDTSPLTDSRNLRRRPVGRCRHYARLPVAILRAKRIPAHSRCGFGAYFNPGFFEDHSVCESWNVMEKRRMPVDAQPNGLQ